MAGCSAMRIKPKRRCSPRRKIRSVCKGVDTSICLSNNKCKLRSRKGKQYCSQISRKPRKNCRRRSSRRSGSRKLKRCPSGSRKVFATLKNGKKSKARYTCESTKIEGTSVPKAAAARRAYYDKLNEEAPNLAALGWRVKMRKGKKLSRRSKSGSRRYKARRGSRKTHRSKRSKRSKRTKRSKRSKKTRRY